MPHIIAILFLLILIFLNLFIGSAEIPAEEIFKVLTGQSDNEVFKVIILENRLPQAITAALAGAALAVSGLIMQTVFANPLAGPSVLGISSAASLGVAVVTFLFSAVFMDFNSTVSVVIGSLMGSAAVLALLVVLSEILKNNLTLLIAGIMISYLSGAAVTVLNFFGTEQSVKNFTVWNMGSFAGVTLNEIPVFAIVVTVFCAAALLTVKPLNLLLLGENYAQNLGVNPARTKTILLLLAGVLVSAVTAHCGPVAFIGLAVPHVARMVLKTSNHKRILPASIYIGACIALMCNILCILPGDFGVLPLNAVTPVFGVPVVLWILTHRQRMKM